MIENIRAYLQRQRDFRAMLRDGVGRLGESDPRAIGLLLGSLQFAGGWYLLVPYTRFLPPFSKLFEVLPSWAWAMYFIVSGIVAMVSSVLPDGANFLRARFLIATWVFFNWCFLSMTSLLAAVWTLRDRQGAVSYGIALGFYPCLTAAALWTSLRVRQILADETAEEFEQERHIAQLKDAAAERGERLKEVAALPKF